ncbi:MAG: ATP-binding protein [candidate division NC10 bacterium]|nr:ATP-binding protein [candidate division NC10 bacterium]
MREGVPAWIAALEAKLEAKTGSVFLLHGNVADYVPLGGEFVPLRTFLIRRFGHRARVICYNRSGGLAFSDSTTEARFRSLVGYAAPPPGSPEALRERAAQALGEPEGTRRLPTAPAQVIPLLDRALQSLCLSDEEQERVLLILEFAETLVPAGDLAALSDEDRGTLVALLRWAEEPRLAAVGTVVLLLVSALSDVHSRLRDPSARVEALEVSLPDYAERLAFLRARAAGDGRGRGLPLEELATTSAGLSRIQLEGLLKEATGRARPLSHEEVKTRKRELLQQEFQGMLETLEPQFGLDAIGGLEPVKTFFREVIAALRGGEAKLVPRGITLVGPPGVGKTALAEALAYECGFNFVKVINARERWVGQSERNYWKILQALRSMTPVVVVEDEADQSEHSRDEASADSGVSNRLRQMRFEFTGDPRIQGQVLWIRISNRPDRLDMAEKRSGRASERIPLVLPDREEMASIFAVMPRKHGFPVGGVDFGALAVYCDACYPGQVTGADIEEISLRAYRHARIRGAGAVEDADYRWAIEDFIPALSAETLRAHEAMAVACCSSRRFLPPRYQGGGRA